jgi:phospholipid transport system substrate-binding protein
MRLTLAAAFAAIFGLAVACAPAVARANSPEETVRTTADEALAILANKSLNNQQKTDQLAKLMDGVSDFETTSKLVLAQGWKSFSDPQRKEFQQLLRDYLIARYRSRIDEYAGQTVQVLSGREEARGDYTVNTKVQTPGKQPIAVAYRMRKDPQGDWRVIDIIGEDISVVSNLRSQFQSLLSQGGPDKLIQTLKDKIASGQAAADNQKNSL